MKKLSKLLRRFNPLSAALVSAGVILLVACGKGPLVDVCISKPAKGGAICVDTKQKPYFKAYEDTEKFLMFSPQDAQKIIESCRLNHTERAMVTGYLEHVSAQAQ